MEEFVLVSHDELIRCSSLHEIIESDVYKQEFYVII